MRIVAISDLHGVLPEVPPCDLLLIVGDVCPATNHRLDFQANWLDTRFRSWLSLQAHCKQVVGIAGNHDFLFQEKPHLVPRDLRWTYLQDEGTEVEGLKIWGTPWQPTFHDWAFNGTPDILKEKWALIPHGTAMLVVHGPPRGYGDLTTRDERTGCPHLLERILKVRPRLVVFGHIHEARGQWTLTHPDDVPSRPDCWEAGLANGELGSGVLAAWQATLANVAILDERYRHVHPPMVFEL